MAENDSSLLTNEMVQDAPTKKKPYTIRDGKGLFVLVHPNGSRYFQLRATVKGKRKLMQIGVYPTISIEEARALAAERLNEEMEEGLASGNELYFSEKAPEQLSGNNFTQKEEVKVDQALPQLTVSDLPAEAPNTITEVSLAYSDIVYVTKNPTKSFYQKFNERYEIEARLASSGKTLREKSESLRVFTIRIVRAAITEIRALMLHCQSIRLTSSIKQGWVKLCEGFRRWRELFPSNLRQLSGAPSKKSLAPQVVAEHAYLGDIKHESPKLNIYTMLRKPATCLVNWMLLLRALVVREDAIDRQDKVAVFGLFVESKGNYLIYTTKWMVAFILAKKG